MSRAREDNIELLLLLAIGGYVAWPYIRGFIAPKAQAATPSLLPAVTTAAEPNYKKVAGQAAGNVGGQIVQAKAPAGTPRGIRNNNPGNIKRGASNWRGKIGNDGTFEVFDTPTNGIRAAMVLLRTYYNTYKLDTLRKIGGRWAPPSENVTSAWVSNVARYSGIGADTLLDLNNRDTMFRIIRGITAAENGAKYAGYYPDSTLAAAWSAM